MGGRKTRFLASAAMILALSSATAQEGTVENQGEKEWGHTRRIMDCAPELVDRRDLAEDRFDHWYVTSNPRDIEVAYFSVEPLIRIEERSRFCEAMLPAAGVSESYFRATYTTTYTLPGSGYYEVEFASRALVFNNELRLINPQNTHGEIVAMHRLEIELDTALNPPKHSEECYKAVRAYSWELEIDSRGEWRGKILPGDLDWIDLEVPAGVSSLDLEKKIMGPGKVIVRESVIFRITTVSAYKYDPIFQAPCLFSLEPLNISARWLPCEN